MYFGADLLSVRAVQVFQSERHIFIIILCADDDDDDDDEDGAYHKGSVCSYCEFCEVRLNLH